MPIRNLTHPFAPHYDEKSRILILGSFPSVISTKEGYYYANPKNRFYKVLSALFNDDFVLPDWPQKRILLSKHHIALYDVIMTCSIEGSSDASITNIIPSDIPNILQNSSINRIICNGQKAYDTYQTYFSHLSIKVTKLPSTSPANAAITLSKLINAWSIIKTPPQE